MVRDSVLNRDIQIEDPFPYELADEFRVMKHLELRAKLGVVILEHIVTMGAMGNEIFEFPALDGLNLVLDDGLEHIFIAQRPSRFATALLIVSENGELETGLFENAHEIVGNLLLAEVIGRAASNPKEHIAFLSRAKDRNLSLLNPLGTGFLRPEGIAGPFHRLERDGGILRNLTAHHDLGSAEFHDVRYMVDPGRADLHARTARPAFPDGHRIEGPPHDERGLMRPAVIPRMSVSVPVDRVLSVFPGELFQIVDQFLGRKGMMGEMGRADVLTSATTDASVNVEALFPGEVLDRAHPHIEVVRSVRVIEQGLDIYAGERALGLQGAEEDVCGNQEHVEKLRIGKSCDENEEDGKMEPPE
jgi:hypothetical protein